MRILNAEPQQYSGEARRILAAIGEVVDAPLSQAELQERIHGFDVVMVRLGLQVDRAVIDAGSHLQAIVTATTGLDHIDVGYAKTRQVDVLSLRGETEFLRSIHATAEHTWALLLALIRHLPEAVVSVRQGQWNRDAYRGRELSGRRLGIIGLGRIGEQVARYGQTFGMSVAAFSPGREEWPDGVERCQQLEQLLRRSDVLSIHVPLMPATSGMLGSRELALLPAGAVVVNTARGGVLDETALMERLTSGHLAGAALDVINGELDATARLQSRLVEFARTHPQLLITPHIGGATVESMARTEIFMAEKLQRWVEAKRRTSPCAVS